MKKKIEYYSRNGQWSKTIELPAINIVCPLCSGKGKHVNPAIDGNGLSQEDFDNDPDFAESYFSGVYDVTCYECNGNNVVSVVDEKRLTKREKILYDAHCKTELKNHAEMRAEREWEY